MYILIGRAVTSIRIIEYPQIIPDDPSTRICDPGSRFLTGVNLLLELNFQKCFSPKHQIKSIAVHNLFTLHSASY